MNVVRGLAYGALLLLLAACQPQPPDGFLVCGPGNDCPGGLLCIQARCYRPDTDLGALDLGSPDLGRLDSGSDAGPDLGPPDAGPLEEPRTIALGTAHSCTLLDSGDVYCWGDNREGQLGNGQEDDDPVTLPGLVEDLPAGVEQVEAGETGTCVRSATAVHCWGSRNFFLGAGVIGVPGIERALRPIAVDLPGDPLDIAVGWQHACAVVAPNGEVLCWGSNRFGQLGTGDDVPSEPPLLVDGLRDVVDVCAAAEHTCAVRADGTAACWGHATEGRLGNGWVMGVDPDTETEPVAVAGIRTARTIHCGHHNTCVLTGDGATRRALCWGPNEGGQLGQPADDRALATTPIELDIDAAAGFRALALGGRPVGGFNVVSHGVICGFGDAQTPVCAGWNATGELGIGSVLPPSRSTFEAVPSVDRVLDVAVGAGHVCAIEGTRGEATLSCWGLGTRGQLGNANAAIQTSPVGVEGF